MKKQRLIYSTEIAEIIGKPPRFILRAGGAMLLCLMILLLGIGNYISLPDNRIYKIKIFGQNRPLYIVGSQSEKAQFSGKAMLVSRGASIALHHTDIHHSVNVIAPFDGTLLPYNVQGSDITDTLALFVPRHNTYSFTLRVPVADFNIIKKGAVVAIDLPSRNINKQLNLKGIIQYQYPATDNMMLTYSGTLDSISSIFLNQDFPGYTNLEATINVKHNGKPVIRQLFN